MLHTDCPLMYTVCGRLVDIWNVKVPRARFSGVQLSQLKALGPAPEQNVLLVLLYIHIFCRIRRFKKLSVLCRLLANQLHDPS